MGILYLCCDDLDTEALESLAQLDYEGVLYLIIHDDSKSNSTRAQVDATAERLRRQKQWEVMVLRRPRREGGKAGALNYVLDQTAHLYEYFLLCDNDSTAQDVLTIEKALPYFQDENVAIVQCRSVAVDSPDYSPVNRLLSRSINAFHVFFSVQSKFGWQPFIGHNAFLRTRSVREVGGFTPGFFSDDLDLTVRLNLKGYAVAYAPEISIGEKHPAQLLVVSQAELQVGVRLHADPEGTRCFGIDESPLLFCREIVVLSIRGILCRSDGIVALSGRHFPADAAFLADLPDALGSQPDRRKPYRFPHLPAYPGLFHQRKKAERLLGLHGGLRISLWGNRFFLRTGGLDCLFNRDKEWIPTNSRSEGHGNLGLMAEALYGILLLSIPAISFPALMYLPCSYLFGGKFLFGPAISVLYDDHATRIVPRWKLSRAFIVTILAAVIVSLFFMVPSQAQHSSQTNHQIQISGKELYVDGSKFQVKGIHYGPWRPGTGPNKHYPYPSPKEIEEDFRLIDKTNANTIFVYNAPAYVLDIAEEHGLMVLYCFSVEWWTIGTSQHATERENILTQVRAIRGKPALLGWVLGNEISTDIVAHRGEKSIEKGLE